MKKTPKILTALFAAALGLSASAAEKITVFAAASMSDVLQQVADEYQKAKPDQSVVFSFASSSTLAKQIEQGAPADLFISANKKWMAFLAEKDALVKDSESILVGNELVLIAPTARKAEPVDVAGGLWTTHLQDSFLSVGDPAHVPAGQYAQEALTNLNLWDKVSGKLARGKDVRAALALVERNEAPYGIVYGTDAKVSPKVKVVGVFPQGSYKAIEYPVAILKDHDKPEVREFLQYLKSDAAKAAFQQYGFATY